MPLTLTWSHITLRLFLTLLAGLLIGINRGEHGRPAGMRTTILVCLTASLSMILSNILLDTRGKSSDSFVVLDLMRLPLGVLTGMGFIGAGTILRRDNLVLGITTSATLWFVTMLGMCFGAGANALGIVCTVIALAVLWGLKWIENAVHQDTRATLDLTITGDGPSDDEIRRTIACSCPIVSWGIHFCGNPPHRDIRCELRWRIRAGETCPPPFIAELSKNPRILSVQWQPQGIRFEAAQRHEEKRPDAGPIPTRVHE